MEEIKWVRYKGKKTHAYRNEKGVSVSICDYRLASEPEERWKHLRSEVRPNGRCEKCLKLLNKQTAAGMKWAYLKFDGGLWESSETHLGNFRLYREKAKTRIPSIAPVPLPPFILELQKDTHKIKRWRGESVEELQEIALTWLLEQ